MFTLRTERIGKKTYTTRNRTSLWSDRLQKPLQKWKWITRKKTWQVCSCENACGWFYGIDTKLARDQRFSFDFECKRNDIDSHLDLSVNFPGHFSSFFSQSFSGTRTHCHWEMCCRKNDDVIYLPLTSMIAICFSLIPLGFIARRPRFIPLAIRFNFKTFKLSIF